MGFKKPKQIMEMPTRGVLPPYQLPPLQPPPKPPDKILKKQEVESVQKLKLKRTHHFKKVSYLKYMRDLISHIFENR